MKSIAYIPGSDGAANASLMTVSNVRAPLASTILVNTVANVPDKFYASMGTPNTFTDPVTGETITVISEATAVDFAGHIDGSNIEIDEIAPGYTDNGSEVGDIIVIRPITEWANNIHNLLSEAHNDDGSIKADAVIYQPTAIDHVSSGGVWSALTGLNAAMTALTVYQAGYRGTVAAVASRAFTASKDTYVDVLRTLSGYTNTFTLVYTEVTNGAAAPALASNSVRIAKVVTSGAAVTSVVQYGLDSLSNVIYPRLANLPPYYSSQEMATGEYWIDGKPIYRKVTVASISGSTTEQFVNSIASTSATLFIRIDALSIDTVSASKDSYPNGYSNYNAPSVQSFSGKGQLNSGAWRFAFVSLTSGTIIVTAYYVK